MDKKEMALISAETEVNNQMKNLQKRIDWLKETLDGDLTNEGFRNEYIARAEDVRSVLESLMAAKKVLKALEGLE